jgi:hypothetical protein
MPPPAPAWLLLITNLPGRNPTLRMRFWRSLKAAGAGLLRDGAYLLPNGERSREILEEQGAEIKAAGGLVQVLSFDAESPEQHADFVALFDRAAEYAEAIRRVEALKRELVKLAEPEARQRLTGITREVATIAARDFFPSEPRNQMEGVLADAEAALNARFAPDEPHVKDCPKRALGFDFDGAEFTHVDSKVTFEVLLSSFNLDQDAGLVRLGALVHHLDVGGIPIAEAPGFATIMAGARSLQRDDDDLLRAMTPVLDSLYAGYTDTIRNG